MINRSKSIFKKLTFENKNRSDRKIQIDFFCWSFPTLQVLNQYILIWYIQNWNRISPGCINLHQPSGCVLHAGIFLTKLSGQSKKFMETAGDVITKTKTNMAAHNLPNCFKNNPKVIQLGSNTVCRHVSRSQIKLWKDVMSMKSKHWLTNSRTFS